MQLTSKIGAVNVSQILGQGSLKVSYPRKSDQERTVVVKLLNAFGDEVNVPVEVNSVSVDSIEITIKDQPSGIFYLKIQDDMNYIIKKLILQ